MIFSHKLIFETISDVRKFDENQVKPTDFDLMAFHAMGTCRMGIEPENSVVKVPSLEVHGVNGLFVADASIFPTSLGVNPMIAIMAYASACADYIGRNKERYF